MKFCFRCYTEWTEISQPGAYTQCSKCGQDLHVCLNCRNFDKTKPNQCKILDIDLVQDKGRGNHCDEFQFVDRELKARDKTEKKPDVRSRWDKLFK